MRTSTTAVALDDVTTIAGVTIPAGSCGPEPPAGTSPDELLSQLDGRLDVWPIRFLGNQPADTLLPGWARNETGATPSVSGPWRLDGSTSYLWGESWGHGQHLMGTSVVAVDRGAAGDDVRERWSLLQDCGTGSSANWGSTARGTYWVQVWVASAGSLASYEAWKNGGPFHVQ